MSYLKNRQNSLTKHKCPICPERFAVFKNYQKHIVTHGVRDLYRVPKLSFSGFLQDRQWGAAVKNATYPHTKLVEDVIPNHDQGSVSYEQDITFANNMTLISGEDFLQSSDIVITQQPIRTSSSSLQNAVPGDGNTEQNGDMIFVGLSCETVDDEYSENANEIFKRRKIHQQSSDKKMVSPAQENQSDRDTDIIVVDDSSSDIEILSDEVTGSFDNVRDNRRSVVSVERTSEPSGNPRAASGHTSNLTNSRNQFVPQTYSSRACQSVSQESRTLLNLDAERCHNPVQTLSDPCTSPVNLAKNAAMAVPESIQVCVKGATKETCPPVNMSNTHTSRIKDFFEKVRKGYHRGSSTIEEYEELSCLLSCSFLQRFRCRYCSLSFVNFDSYSTHLHSHRRRLFRLRNVKRKHLYGRSFVPFTVTSIKAGTGAIESNVKLCPTCGKGFTGAAWVVHYYSRCLQKRQCQYCSKRFNTSKQLRDHESLHLSVTPYQCAICGHGFAVEKYYKMHMSRHTVKVQKVVWNRR